MSARYLIGDVLEVAKTIEPGSVDLIVSSPPFLAVRSYLPADHPDKGKEGGQQSTPGGYIDWLIDVVEALAPTLAPHGSLVFELGDTYAGSGGAGGDYNQDGWREGQPRYGQNPPKYRGYDGRGERDTSRLDSAVLLRNEGGTGWPRAKSKSLIPELFRLALTYGVNPLTGRETERWILRNVITWCRPNPTPGALGDKVRPATSDIAVLTRSGKRWFDLDAERGAVSDWTRYYGERPYPESERAATEVAKVGRARSGGRAVAGDLAGGMLNQQGAPLLDFWVLPPGGYSGAHYAVWPPELVRRLISLMCPLRVCVTCGEPSRRITDSHPILTATGGRSPGGGRGDGIVGLGAIGHSHSVATDRTTLGWSDCGHDNFRDGRVLDPFVGSGTTLAVASGMGHDSIGIDLDERNVELARERVGMFLTET